MPEQEVGLRLSLRDRRETAAGLRETDRDLDRVGRSAETSGRRARIASKGFVVLGKAAKVGLLGAAAGITAVAAASVGFVKSAAEDQKSARKLAVTLRNTTGARRRDIKSIESWISAQGKALGVADDDLRPAISTLATATGDLTKARKLTTLANNIAVGKDKSLASVATALGKAYTGNVAGLARLGVATKDAEGNTLTFDQVQRKLARTFSGQAAAAADTAAGKYERFKLALSETGEAIGYRLLPYADRLGDYLTDKGIPLVGRWGDKIDTKVIPAIEGFVRKARPLANEVLPAVADGLGTIRDVASKIAGPLTRTFKAFNGLPDWAKSAIAIGAGGAVVASKLRGGKGLVAGALGGTAKGGVVKVFVTNPGFGRGSRIPAGAPAAAAGAGAAVVGAATAAAAAVVTAGAYGIGKYLGSRDPADVSAAQKARYHDSVTAYGSNISKISPVTIQMNPLTGLPLISSNVLYDPKVAAGLVKNVSAPLNAATGEARVLGTVLGDVSNKRVTPKIDLIGYPSAMAALQSIQAYRIQDKSFTVTKTTNATLADAAVPSAPASPRRRAMPKPPQSPRASTSAEVPSAGGGERHNFYRGDTLVPINLDGRRLTEATLDQLASEQARR